MRIAVGFVAVAAPAGWSGHELCRGEVGPETVVIDAEAFVEPGADVRVCFTVSALETYCGEPGTPRISRTAHTDYPREVPYFVRVTTGVGQTSPDDGSGTHLMTCTQTTTNIVLPNG